MSDKSLNLTPANSNALKGIALLFLLIHHLFYIKNGMFDDIEIYHGHYLVNMIGQACKVCVPLFVFLSGYGLTAAAEKTERINMKHFYVHRFSKLYLNYWLIYILFVPIGVALGLTFDKVYGNHTVAKAILDFLGLINLAGGYGYNPTWWFYSCITVLYLLFPFIMTGCRRNKILMHVILWGGVAILFCPFTPLQPIRFYLLTFILGCYFRNGLIGNLLPPPIKKLGIRTLQGNLTSWESVILLSVTILSIPARFIVPYALVFDTVITILIVLTYKNIKLNPYLSNSLEFCGKHSFNIFLFHTFLFYLYIPQIIYWHRNPIIILITLLLFCIPISMGIEYGKKKLGYYKLLLLLNHRFRNEKPKY